VTPAHLQWDLLLAMLVYAAAGFGLWNRFVRPRVPWPWALAILAFALAPVLPSLEEGRRYGPLDTNAPNLPWATAETRGYLPKATRLNDVTLQFVPWQLEARRQLLSRRPPLLNAYSGSGQALLGNGQSAPFSLVSLLSLPFDPQRAQALRAFLKILLALWGTWAAARQLEVRGLFSCAAAVAYAYGGSMTAWQLFPHAEVMALWPFLFLAGERLFVDPRDQRSRWLAGLAIAGIVLAGHPETAAVALLAWVVRWSFGARVGEATHRHAVRAMAAIAGLALLATSFSVLPVAETILNSEKLLQERGGWSADRPPGLEAPAAAVLNMVVPGFFGTPQEGSEGGPAPLQWLAEGSVGLPALALAAVGGFLGSGRREARRYLALIAAAAFALHLIPQKLLAPFLVLPPLSLIAVRYFAYIGGFAVALLSALALEAWADGASRRVRGALAVSAGAAAVAAGLCFVLRPQVWAAFGGVPSGALLAASGRHALVALVVALILAAALLLLRPPVLVGSLVVALSLLQLHDAYGGYVPHVPSALAYPPVPLLSRLAAEREPFRLVGSRGVLTPNASTVYRLRDIRTHDPTESARYVAWLVDVLDFELGRYHKAYRPKPEHLSLLRLLAVRFVLTGEGTRLPPPWLDRGLFETTRLWEVPGKVQWAFFPKRILPVASAVEARTALRRSGSPFRLAPIELGTGGPAAPNGRARVLRVEHRSEGIELSVAAGEEAWLVVSQVALPGWRARVDGRPAEIVPAYGALLAVRVPAGASRVTIFYRPRTWTVGVVVSTMAIVSLGVTLVVRRRSKRVVDA
jgi:hypothetical protein